MAVSRRSARTLLIGVAVVAFATLATDSLLSAGIGDPIRAAGDCGTLLLIGDGLCTHGPDTAPAAAAGANSPGAAVPTRNLTCIGNGSDGQRVEVLYAYGPGATAASSSRVTEITRWVKQVEWTVFASADRLGGNRQVRWRTTSDCAPVITSVKLTSGAINDVGTMMDELSDLGYRRTDRSYLVFVRSSKYCGIGTITRDDAASNNKADRTTGYARVDEPCWDAGDEGYHSVAAHELLHTLGAVQESAPHATRGGHCTDEHDLMCYDDGTGGTIKTVCQDSSSSTKGAGDANDRLLDCGGDDYFHPAPKSGSYLATRWNTARSARLHDPAAKQAASNQKPKPTLTGDPVGYVRDLILD